MTKNAVIYKIITSLKYDYVLVPLFTALAYVIDDECPEGKAMETVST
jgi:hypothetical protein